MGHACVFFHMFRGKETTFDPLGNPLNKTPLKKGEKNASGEQHHDKKQHKKKKWTTTNLVKKKKARQGERPGGGH